ARGRARSVTCRNARTLRFFYELESKGALNFSVKLLYRLAKTILVDIDDAHFARGILFRIARVSGIDHDGLAEFTANRTGRGFGRIGGTKNIPDLPHGFDPFINQGNALLRAWLVQLAHRTF